MKQILQVPKYLLIAGLAFSLSGCVTTVAMRPGKVIEKKGSMFNRTFEQDGKTLDIMDMFDKVGKVQVSASKMNTGKIFYYSTLVAAGIGGFYLGKGLASSNGSSDTTTGVVIIGLSIGGLYFADKYIGEGIDLYNGTLGVRKRSGFNFQFAPQFANDRLDGGSVFAQFKF